MVAVFLATGFEEIEALTVVDLCRRAGIPTEMVSVTGEKEVVSSHGIAVKADALFAELDFANVEMIVLPGGMPGTLNLEAYQPLMEQVKDFYGKGKYISAICAAPTIFGHLGLLKGRKACCYPGMEEGLLGAEVTKEPVVVSDHVLTGRGMGAAVPFGLKIVERFLGKQTAEELSEKIVF